MSSPRHQKPREKLDAYLKRHRGNNQFTLVGPMLTTQKHFVDPVIFVDGGSIRREAGVGICVGDGDSSEIPMDLTLDPHKDFSDLSFALGLIPDAVTEISLQGFLGGRRDHELFNFGEVFHFLKHRRQPGVVWFNREVAAVGRGDWQFEISGLFSLMTLETTNVTMKGDCHYPIDPPRQVAPLCSFGLSNIGEGTISIQANHPIFIVSENLRSVQPANQPEP